MALGVDLTEQKVTAMFTVSAYSQPLKGSWYLLEEWCNSGDLGLWCRLKFGDSKPSQWKLRGCFLLIAHFMYLADREIIKKGSIRTKAVIKVLK